MRNLDLLPIDETTSIQISQARDKLLAFGGVKVDILEFADRTIRIRVEQLEVKNNYMLTQAQLVARAGVLFAPLERKYKLHFVALTYSPNLEPLTHEWINERMLDLKITRNDLIKQIGIDKSTLSELLSGNRSLTKFQKAAFYYYFLSFELNRDFREYLEEEQ